MISKVFLDTNILVDYAIKNRPHHNEAAQLLENCLENSILLTTSAAGICTLIYLLEKDRWPHETVKEWLLSFSNLVEMVNTPNTDLVSAASSVIPDTEDALLMFTAISNSCDAFVTRNLKDFPRERKDILVLSPEELMRQISLK